jgi:hypothetical protein
MVAFAFYPSNQLLGLYSWQELVFALIIRRYFFLIAD